MGALYPWLVRPAVQRAILAAIGMVAVWWLLAAVERAAASLQASIATILEHWPPATPTQLESGGGMDLMFVCDFDSTGPPLYLFTFLTSALVSTIMAVSRRRIAARCSPRHILR